MLDVKVFSGSANPLFAEMVAKHLGIKLGAVHIGKFSDGETKIRFDDSVRGDDVYIIQPSCPNANENLMELFIMIDALKRASAKRITAVIPYYGYACQEKKDTPREPITARLVADFLEKAGANRVITMDLHAGAIQGFFDIPVDHLTAIPVFVKYFKEKGLKDMVFVSADEGRAKHVRSVSSQVGAPLAVGYKFHPDSMVSSMTHLAGNVQGKTPIIVEDMIRTGGSIVECVHSLLMNGANPEIYIAATHGLFTNNSFKKLSIPEIKEVIVTDTIPLYTPNRIDAETQTVNVPENFRILSVSNMFAEAIKRIHHNESISSLYI